MAYKQMRSNHITLVIAEIGVYTSHSRLICAAYVEV
jgi:hypothetical protein